MSPSNAIRTWCMWVKRIWRHLLRVSVSMSQALALVSDLKLGLYCKIPPKTMFFVQSAGTALGAIVNYSQ